MVIKKDNNIEYILYKYYDFSSHQRRDEIIYILKQEGYKELNYYKEECEKKLRLEK